MSPLALGNSSALMTYVVGLNRSVLMSVAAVGSTPVIPMGAERMEGAGPDHDGDSDDAGAVTQPVQAPPAPGTGKAVDKTA